MNEKTRKYSIVELEEFIQVAMKYYNEPNPRCVTALQLTDYLRKNIEYCTHGIHVDSSKCPYCKPLSPTPQEEERTVYTHLRIKDGVRQFHKAYSELSEEEVKRVPDKYWVDDLPSPSSLPTECKVHDMQGGIQCVQCGFTPSSVCVTPKGTGATYVPHFAPDNECPCGRTDEHTHTKPTNEALDRVGVLVDEYAKLQQLPSIEPLDVEWLLQHTNDRGLINAVAVKVNALLEGYTLLKEVIERK